MNAFVAKARQILKDQRPANMLLLRGFSQQAATPVASATCTGCGRPPWPSTPCIAGLARLVGMDLLPPPGKSPADEFATVAAHWDDYDFFYVHIKGTDSAGEDGDFARKVAVIEEVDRALPALLALKPDVLMVGADHSTPAAAQGRTAGIRSPF